MAALVEERVPAAQSASRQWPVWGTLVTVAVQPTSRLAAACGAVREVIAAFEVCNRFRDDSELSRLNAKAGEPVHVGGVLMGAVMAALRAAALTDGAVVPTIGQRLVELGYDRDFDELLEQAEAYDSASPLPDAAPCPPWQSVTVDLDAGTVTVPPGSLLDLGATAKALCADWAATRAAEHTGASVLVDIGGDIAVAGPPPLGGWPIAVVENARRDACGDAVVAIGSGGLASSGTTARAWRIGGRDLHHIIDAASGWPAEPVWRLVTVAAGSCVDANTASTAAVVWGEDAIFRLAQAGLPARLVRADGSVELVGGWPYEAGPATAEGCR